MKETVSEGFKLELVGQLVGSKTMTVYPAPLAAKVTYPQSATNDGHIMGIARLGVWKAGS